MAITRYDPLRELTRLERDLDRVFGRVLSEPIEPLTLSTPAWTPTTDVMREGDDLMVRAELPGMRPEDIEVSVTDRRLTIRGERSEEHENEERGYMFRESRYGSFERTVAIPAGIDASQVRAEYHDGVLEVTVPGAYALSEPRSVKVEVRTPELETREVPVEQTAPEVSSAERHEEASSAEKAA
jgi:HSP20 family protein